MAPAEGLFDNLVDARARGLYTRTHVQPSHSILTWKDADVTETHLPVVVVTDSAASIPGDLVRAYGIEVIPFQVIWDGHTYLDGVDLTPDEFYRRFRETTTRPTTAVPTPGQFAGAFARATSRASGIVGVFVSGALTSTVDAAIRAADGLPVPVRIVDSRTALMAEGWIALAAARAAARGASLEEAAAAAEAARSRSVMIATLQTLEHLIRGGRAGKVARLATSHIHVQPVVTISDGTVAPVAVARSPEKAEDRVVEAMQRGIGDRPFRASVFHGESPEEAESLAARVRSLPNCLEFFMSHLTPVAGAHAGPAVLGVAYCVEE